MILNTIVKDVYSIFLVGNKPFYLSNKQIVSPNINKKVHVWAIGNILKSDNVIASIFDKKIEIYNTDLIEINIVENQNINLESGLTLFDENNFVVHNFTMSDTLLFFEHGKLSQEKNGFWGSILNRNFILNYQEGTFNNPRYFRCSNLLDTETYWDYDCGEGKEAGKFYVWNDNLVFTKGNHEGTNLVVIELITGRVLWEIPILYGAFSFDSERGLLVSFWCSKLSGNNYQIIDLQHKSIENGTPDFSVLLENVALNWQMQYLYENKLYFVDNVYSIHGEPSRAPRFGRFDIKTKRIDFLQEVPEASGCQFEQVFYHDSKLYLRSSANQLFIFED